MSIDLKPGRWRMRCGKTVIVEDREGKPLYPWRGVDDKGLRFSWKDNGAWVDSTTQAVFDLVAYIGPEEPQATS